MFAAQDYFGVPEVAFSGSFRLVYVVIQVLCGQLSTIIQMKGAGTKMIKKILTL